MSNIVYGVFMAVCAMAAILLKYIDPARIFGNWFAFDICTTTVCFGNQAVYRFSLALVTFFALNLIICYCSPQFHTSSWVTKCSMLSTLVSISFFIPGDVYIVYREISRYFSFFYLLLQILVLINMVYTIHTYLLNKMDSGEENANLYRYAYIAAFVLATIGSLVFSGILYYREGNCDLHDFIISSVLILGVVTILASATATINKGTLTPSLLFAYCIFLCYQALRSNPDLGCNHLAAREVPLWQVILMFLVNSLAIGWNTMRTAQSVHALLHVEQVREAVADDSDGEDTSSHKRIVSRSATKMMSKRGVLYFHASMVLASLHLAMMLTGWGAEETTGMHVASVSEQSDQYLGYLCVVHVDAGGSFGVP